MNVYIYIYKVNALRKLLKTDGYSTCTSLYAHVSHGMEPRLACLWLQNLKRLLEMAIEREIPIKWLNSIMNKHDDKPWGTIGIGAMPCALWKIRQSRHSSTFLAGHNSLYRQLGACEIGGATEPNILSKSHRPSTVGWLHPAQGVKVHGPDLQESWSVVGKSLTQFPGREYPADEISCK